MIEGPLEPGQEKFGYRYIYSGVALPEVFRRHVDDLGLKRVVRPREGDDAPQLKEVVVVVEAAADGDFSRRIETRLADPALNDMAGSVNRLLESVAWLIAAWIVIRLATQVVTQPLWATFIAWVAWAIAALNILDLLAPVMEILDFAGMDIGEGGFRISLLTIAQSTLALAVLISLAVYVTGVLDARISNSRSLSPSLQVLFSKSLKIVLIGLAMLVYFGVSGLLGAFRLSELKASLRRAARCMPCSTGRSSSRDPI